jgi:hypothetical protein
MLVLNIILHADYLISVFAEHASFLFFLVLKGIYYMLVCRFYSRKWRHSSILLDYVATAMAKVFLVFSRLNLHVEFHAFTSCYWLVTWITTSPSCRHLLYAYKLTTCSFVCMGTGEAGPSSLMTGWIWKVLLSYISFSKPNILDLVK